MYILGFKRYFARSCMLKFELCIHCPYCLSYLLYGIAILTKNPILLCRYMIDLFCDNLLQSLEFSSETVFLGFTKSTNLSRIKLLESKGFRVQFHQYFLKDRTQCRSYFEECLQQLLNGIRSDFV
jgi:hypothetical protein